MTPTPYYDPDDIDRIVGEYVANEQEQQRVNDDAAYFLAEIRRDFIAAETARLLHQPVMPDMERPDDRGVRRIEELLAADPAVLVQVTINALWYGGPSVEQAAEAQLEALNNPDRYMPPPGYVGRRRACDDPQHAEHNAALAVDLRDKHGRCVLCGLVLATTVDGA